MLARCWRFVMFSFSLMGVPCSTQLEAEGSRCWNVGTEMATTQPKWSSSPIRRWKESNSQVGLTPIASKHLSLYEDLSGSPLHHNNNHSSLIHFTIIVIISLEFTVIYLNQGLFTLCSSWTAWPFDIHSSIISNTNYQFFFLPMIMFLVISKTIFTIGHMQLWLP